MQILKLCSGEQLENVKILYIGTLDCGLYIRKGFLSRYFKSTYFTITLIFAIICFDTAIYSLKQTLAKKLGGGMFTAI